MTEITLFPGKTKTECQSNFVNLLSCLFMEAYITLLINSVKVHKNSYSPTEVLDCIFVVNLSYYYQ